MKKKKWYYLVIVLAIILLCTIYLYITRPIELKNVNSQMEYNDMKTGSYLPSSEVMVDSASINDKFFLVVPNWFKHYKNILYCYPAFVYRNNHFIKNVDYSRWFCDSSKVFYIGWGSKKIGSIKYSNGSLNVSYDLEYKIKMSIDSLPGHYLPENKEIFAIAASDSTVFINTILRRQSTSEEANIILDLAKSYLISKGRSIPSVSQIKIEQLETLEKKLQGKPIIVGSFSFRDDTKSPTIYDNLFLIAENSLGKYDSTYSVYNECPNCFKNSKYPFTDTKFLDIYDFNNDGQLEIFVEVHAYEYEAVQILQKQGEYWKIVFDNPTRKE